MASASPTKAKQAHESDVRQRILDAASAVFTSKGYAQASTLDIATRAKVSKRDLYALVGNKEDMLVACITERATRLRWPEDVSPPHDHGSLGIGLERFGYQLLTEVTAPAVVSVFRLAIAEAERAPEVARTLHGIGRAASRHTLEVLFTHANAAGLVQGDPAEMGRHFSALLWGDLMLGLLLGVVERPSEQALQQQARQATQAFMRIYCDRPINHTLSQSP